MELEYRIVDGLYVLFDGEEAILSGISEVAIAYDDECGTLLKHGDLSLVGTYAASCQKAYRSAGFDSMANAMKVVSGRFPVDEINRCISITGYVTRFVRKLQDGSIKAAQ